MSHKIRGQTQNTYQNTPRGERELIRQIRAGKKELLGGIIEHYYDEILRFCVWQIRDTGDACDLTQETFYRFLRYVDTYEYRNLRAYLYAIARNLCVDYRKGNAAVPLSEREEGERPAAEGAGWEGGYTQAEDRMLLAELLSRLPAEQREVIILRYYGGFAFAEIAGILDVNLSTVKSRLRLGLKKLKNLAGAEIRKETGGEADGESKGDTQAV